MALLGQLLATLIGGLISWLTQFVTKKLAIVAVAVSLTATLLLAFRAGIDAAVAALASSAPAFLLPTLDLLPHNIGTVGAVVIGAHVAAAVYQYGRFIIDIKVNGIT